MKDLRFNNVYHIKHIRNGVTIWEDKKKNIVTTLGLNLVLDTFFTGSAYTASHYVGLKSAGSVVATDTLTSHPNWTEVTDYSDSTRPALSIITAASDGAISSDPSTLTFTFNATSSIGGVIIATTTDNTGTLFGGISFSQRDVISGDQLHVDIVFTLTN